jgi:hypothetical protein
LNEHFIAFAKNNYKWYAFNDDSVIKIEENKIVSEYECVLFYKQQKDNEDNYWKSEYENLNDCSVS